MVGILGIVDMSIERDLLKRIRLEMMLPANIEEEIDSILEKPDALTKQDAALIAASPELLDVLIEITKSVQYTPQCIRTTRALSKAQVVIEKVLDNDYTKPPARQGLSREQLAEFALKANCFSNPYEKFARLIEQAHNIGDL
jgi:hypothetical protein